MDNCDWYWVKIARDEGSHSGSGWLLIRDVAGGFVVLASNCWYPARFEKLDLFFVFIFKRVGVFTWLPLSPGAYFKNDQLHTFFPPCSLLSSTQNLPSQTNFSKAQNVRQQSNDDRPPYHGINYNNTNYDNNSMVVVAVVVRCK